MERQSRTVNARLESVRCLFNQEAESEEGTSSRCDRDGLCLFELWR